METSLGLIARTHLGRRLVVIGLLALVATVLPQAQASAQEVGNALNLTGTTNTEYSTRWSQVVYTPLGDDGPETPPTEALLGRDDLFADNLSAGALMGGSENGRPLYLTPTDSLDNDVLTELQRTVGDTGSVTILGGEQAISSDVEAELADEGFTVDRLSGTTRIETAVDVAQDTDSDTVLVVRGFASDNGDPTQAFADSLGAGALAAANGWEILFTQTEVLTGNTADELEAGNYSQAYVVGGTDAVSDDVLDAVTGIVPDTTRVAGPSRWDTAIELNDLREGDLGDFAIIIDGQVGDSFADAFPAANLSGLGNYPVVLSNDDEVPMVTADYLEENYGSGANTASFNAHFTDITLVCGNTVSGDVCQDALDVINDGGTVSEFPPTGAGMADIDLTEGAVFAMSNARDGNTVVAYDNVDGELVEIDRYDTEGTGSGSFEDTANGLILVTADGQEISPNNLADPTAGEQQFLLATNAGSDSLSVFTVNPDGLELVDVQDTTGTAGDGGEKPISVTVNDGLVFVLNSGEATDDLFDEDGMVIQNCSTGMTPRITGFTMADDGQLTALPGSSRDLSGEEDSGCAQVSFTPDGDRLVVTERTSQPAGLGQMMDTSNETIDDEGVIVLFDVIRDTDDDPTLATVGMAQVMDATGQGPFGFTFTPNGTLLTTEQFDGPMGVGLGAATSYTIEADGTLTSTATSIGNGGTDTCWVVATDDGSIAFATSFFGDGRISSYTVDDDGLGALIDPVATSDTDDATDDGVAMGASDLALNNDSSTLYQLNSLAGTINALGNNGDGTLTAMGQVTPFPQPAFGPDGGMGAPIGLAAN